MGWFSRARPGNPGVIGMQLVRAAGVTVDDDLLRALGPAVERTRNPEFAAELLIYSLFPFDLVNVTSGHELAPAISEAIVVSALEIANAGRGSSGTPAFDLAQWRARVTARFREYGECLANERPGVRPDLPMHALGKAATLHVVGAADLAATGVLVLHFSRAHTFARMQYGKLV